MGDNTSTERRKDPNNSLILQEVWKILVLDCIIECAVTLKATTSSTPEGQIWVQGLLDGHPGRIRNELGVRKQVFKKLIEELSAQGYTHSEHVTLEEQLGIFLYTCATGLSCRHVGERIDRSSNTVKKYFCKMLHAFSSAPIYTKYVKSPRSDDPTPAHIADDPIMYPFFKDAIGAIDGMHIVCTPPTTEKRTYRNHRGFYSQYSLVCCNFNLEFTYVVSGWEGCATDEQVYCNARTKGLLIPAGKYYLADAAFPACPQLLLPYRSIQHHLPGWEREQTRPTNMHEYFNLRHAQLRNVVERAIHLLKQRFRILVVAPEYEMDIQARIPFALCCVHNIICRWDPKDVEGREVEQAAPAPASIARSTGKSKDKLREACGSVAKYWFTTASEHDMMVEKREEIASWLWKDRLNQYPRSQDHDV